VSTNEEHRLEAENADLRGLLAQAGIDAAEHKLVERLQRILLEELHHRVQNTLTMVMAITSQSLRRAESIEHGRQAIESRLLALGRVHDLLLRTNWRNTTLATILKTAIQPFVTPGTNQFFVQCVEIEVGSAAALSLSMILNELCTNAIKYGALSTPRGQVEITATLDEDHKQFQLRWAEKGGPVVQMPGHRGFGTRLIERSFASQLEGVARLTFEPSGVVCLLDIPLTSLQSLQAK
jgi:two-component sensor histidine kinase